MSLVNVKIETCINFSGGFNPRNRILDLWLNAKDSNLFSKRYASNWSEGFFMIQTRAAKENQADFRVYNRKST